MTITSSPSDFNTTIRCLAERCKYGIVLRCNAVALQLLTYIVRILASFRAADTLVFLQLTRIGILLDKASGTMRYYVDGKAMGGNTSAFDLSGNHNGWNDMYLHARYTAVAQYLPPLRAQH